MNTNTAAQELLTDANFRFTIREISRGDLRKRMTAARFLSKRDAYRGRMGIRVDVTDLTTGAVQTWDLGLTKRYWA